MRDSFAFESDSLPNDLMVDCKYVPGEPLNASIFVYSGVRHDPEGLEGLHHLLEHAFTIGREEEIEDAFKEDGGVVELGETDVSYMRFHFRIPPTRQVAQRSFARFGSLLLESELTSNLEPEREVVLGEYREAYPRKSKYDLAHRGVRAVYHDSWHERFVDPLGTPESIQRITRKDLCASRDRSFCSSNTHIVAYGGMKLDDLVEMLAETPFGAKRPGVRSSRLPVFAQAGPLPETRVEYAKSKYLSEQAEGGDYYTLARLPGTLSPEAIELFVTLLNRRLFRKVRVENGVYKSGAEYMTYEDGYEFEISYSSIRSAVLDKVDASVNDCIRLVAKDDDLFAKEQNFAIKGAFNKERSGAEICEQAVGDLLCYGRIRSVAESKSSYERVTMDDIRSIVALLSPERRWTLLSPP